MPMVDYDDRPRFESDDDVRTESASFVTSMVESDLDGLFKDIDQLASRLKPLLPEERKDLGQAVGEMASSGESILVRRLNAIGRKVTTARTLVNELAENVQS